MIWDFPYDSSNAIIQILNKYGYAMSKKFGQNFLISLPIRERIVSSLHLSSSSSVWEIGPGIGSLTSLLLRTGAKVTAFEIDHGFCNILKEEAFVNEERFHLVEGDVLKTWKDEYKRSGVPDVLCGNLPYNVGSICVARFLEQGFHPPLMVFTLQREVAVRISAKPGSKDWSTLSILAQIDYDVELLFSIKGGSFFPPPQVESSVVALHKKNTPVIPQELRSCFLDLIADLFRQKRKTIKNNLLRGKFGSRYGKLAVESVLSKASIEESERAEHLDVSQLLNLANCIHEYNG